MNREHRCDTFNETLIPTREEVNNWDLKRDGPCCTDERFRPDLNSTPGTPWNKSAISVFVHSFLNCDEPYESDDPQLIARTFKTHLSHLARKYQRSMAGKEDQDKYKHNANREERKRAVRPMMPTAIPSTEAYLSSSSGD